MPGFQDKESGQIGKWRLESFEQEVMNMSDITQEVQVETGKDKVILEGIACIIDQKGVSESKKGENLYSF